MKFWTVKDTVEQIKPPVDSDEEIIADRQVNLPDNDNSELNQADCANIQSIEEKPSVCDREITEDVDIWTNLWEDNSELDESVAIPLTTEADSANIQSNPVETTPQETAEDESVAIPLTTQADSANNIVQSELKTQSTPVETDPRSQRIEFIKGISPVIGAVIGAVAFVSLGSISGFSPIQNSKLTDARSRTPIQLSDQSPSTPSDGWVFIGNVNKISPAFGKPLTFGKPLVEGSQSTNSSVVPSVGTLVTVSFEPGVTLRDNVPQKPNFSYKEQKALDVVKPTEKLKILQVEFITPPQATKSITSVWAKVDRCGGDCN
ncbi:hypothetical protein [Rivularia sp. UHCC 0363]|uniref:hypothetical protein n=1 Tax=Rivularia sp. UHCC 0363 TaxID=3110244 RepID=UPI002B1EB712|nr:hypothetical protein [Rivularia sp. UHCC 0363]MEA5594158.1 hypothetical protein [Rivularia sp. UHCC 0363]